MFVLFFFTLIVSVLSQVPTPPRRVGLQYMRGHPSAKVHLEVFLDLICPDSKEAWPHVKDVANHYGPENVQLTVHLFPLPYHQNAFYASRAAFVIHYLTNGTRTFDWIDKILLEKLSELTDRSFFNNSDADLLKLFTGWVSEMGINKTAFMDLVDRRTNNDFEKYTKVMWKMACSRGVTGTPVYFVNGVNQPKILQSWGLPDWQLFLDPLLQPQLFDAIDEVEDSELVTHWPCTEKSTSSTTAMTTQLCIIFAIAALVSTLNYL